MSLLLLLRGPGGVSVELAGTTTGSSSASGALTITRPLSGETTGTSSTAGSLALRKPLAGAPAGTSAAAGVLTVIKGLSGSAVGTTSVAGSLALVRYLSGLASGTSSATARLTVAGVAPALTVHKVTAGRVLIVSARRWPDAQESGRGVLTVSPSRAVEWEEES